MAAKAPSKAKSTRPDYKQATAWIPADLHAKVQVKLITPTRKHEYSDLIAHLLRQWLKDGAVPPK